MAITPAQAQKLTRDLEAEVKQWEQKIDKALQKAAAESFDLSKPVYVDIDSMGERVVGELIRRYERAGWSATVYYDQRDGNSLIFQPKK